VKRIRSAFALGLIAAVAFAACGSDDEDTDTTTAATTAGTGDTGTTAAPQTTTSGPMTVTVGKANFPESELISEIWAQTLEANGVRVARKDPIGSRELYYQAIVNNEIQLVPEYTNSLLSYVLRLDDPNASPTAKNVEEQITALGAALPPELVVGSPSTAEDKDVIVCSAEVAEEHSLATLSDLAAVSGEITLGAPPEFEERSPFGLVGFKEIYDAEFKEFVPLDIGVMAASIKDGAIDCGNMFSTMSAITTEAFVALEDDKVIVPNEAVLPLMRAEVAPTISTILDQVNAQLTTDILKALMVKIEVDKRAPSDVAKEYLTSIGSGG
jgi:osmoprotectant transport system substrate-binding protein